MRSQFQDFFVVERLLFLAYNLQLRNEILRKRPPWMDSALTF